MDRREHLKLLLTGSIGTGLLLTTPISNKDLETSQKIIQEYSYGRTKEEQKRDERLHSETFFTEHEMKTVEALCDIIIPSDEVSGSANDAGVPDFIEFIMKDMPYMQVPTRGGLMWLDNQCKNRFNHTFVDCSSEEQIAMIDEIAFPDKSAPDMEYGVRFFNRMRDLTATGFFTSEMGIQDIGYVGNRANLWDGVPDEVLKKHGLSYDQKTLNECLRPTEYGRIAEWDENGNLIRE